MGPACLLYSFVSSSIGLQIEIEGRFNPKTEMPQTKSGVMEDNIDSGSRFD